jgi:hypothetical protein
MTKLIPKEKYAVFPCASQLDDECIPAIGIDFQREDGSFGSAYRHLRDRGVFSTLKEAMAEARKVEVESVDENGIVRFVPAKQ